MVKANAKLYLLHGWAVDENNEAKWQNFRNELEKMGIISEFIALPGLSLPLDEVWGLNDYVEYVKSQLPAEKNLILGHSFGGQIAVRLAAENPDLVKALVLLDSAGLRPNGLLITAKRGIFFALAKIGRLLFRSPRMRKLLYQAAGEKDYLQADPLLRQTMSRVVATDINEDLKKVSQPVQLIWGEKDTVTPLSLADRFASLLPKANLQIVSAARHSPQFTHSAQTALIVAKFLKDLK